MSKRYQRVISLILFSVLFLSGCDAVLGEPIAQIPGLVETLAAQTMVAQTQMAPGETMPDTPTPSLSTATETPESVSAEVVEPTVQNTTAYPTSTPLPTLTPDPSRIPIEDEPFTVDPNAPCNAAQFIRDVTIPDDTVVKPQEKFTKIWAIRNVGSCTWQKNEYALVKFWGAPMGTTPPVPLQFDVRPGQTSELAIEMEAPVVPGCWVSNWMLQDGDGNRFGVGPNYRNYFWVQVSVSWPGISALRAG
jgi:hypothetical protein